MNKQLVEMGILWCRPRSRSETTNGTYQYMSFKFVADLHLCSDGDYIGFVFESQKHRVRNAISNFILKRVKLIQAEKRILSAVYPFDALAVTTAECEQAYREVFKTLNLEDYILETKRLWYEFVAETETVTLLQQKLEYVNIKTYLADLFEFWLSLLYTNCTNWLTEASAAMISDVPSLNLNGKSTRITLI